MPCRGLGIDESLQANRPLKANRTTIPANFENKQVFWFEMGVFTACSVLRPVRVFSGKNVVLVAWLVTCVDFVLRPTFHDNKSHLLAPRGMFILPSNIGHRV